MGIEGYSLHPIVTEDSTQDPLIIEVNEAMQSSMFCGESLSFDELFERIRELNERFRNIN